MNTITIIITIAGLALFETISSVDNAVINADVLSSMGKRGKKWFLFWGLIFAVFVVRGLLPWIIFWAAAPSLGIWGSFIAAFSSNPGMERAIGQSAPILLAGGGNVPLVPFLPLVVLRNKEFRLASRAVLCSPAFLVLRGCFHIIRASHELCSSA